MKFSELTECPFCGYDEFYTTLYLCGTTRYGECFNGDEAHNEQMYDSLCTRRYTGKAYCRNCEKYLGNKESNTLSKAAEKQLSQNERRELMNYMDKFATPEEFLQRELCKNKGTQNCINKAELVKIAVECGVRCTGKESKSELVKIVIEKLGGKELERRCNVGVSSHCFCEKYGITKEGLKKLARKGTITITGIARFHAYGSTYEAPLYSVYDYFSFSDKIRK